MVDYKLFISLKSICQTLRADGGVFFYHGLAAAANFVSLRVCGYELGYFEPCFRVALIRVFGKLDGRVGLLF